MAENAKQVRGLLYRLVWLCYGAGLVDVDVEAFLKCVVCAEYRYLLNVFVVLCNVFVI